MKIRLDKNEMPKPPPKEVIDAVKESVENINRYTPQGKVNELIDLLSAYAKVPKESLFLSFGSDVLIKEFIFLFSRGRQVILADPSFYLIKNAAQNTSSPILQIRLKEPEFKLSLAAIMDEINKPTLIVLDNPNNPTGSLIINQNDVKALLDNENVILLIDEAYFEFSNVTYAQMVREYQNLAVVRTLSKSFGLAGSGIGYLIMADLIKEKFKGLEVMLPYPSIIAAIHALRNKDYTIKYIEEMKQEKKRVMNFLLNLGITVYESHANFLLMKTKFPDIPQMLAKHDIFISNLSNYSLSPEHIRVTVGSKDENDYFLNTIKNFIT